MTLKLKEHSVKAVRLNQIIAVEKSIKQKATEMLTALYKGVQHAALFEGFVKKYRPLQEGGEQYPPETKRVQLKATEVVRDALAALHELFDVTLVKDTGNTVAKADVVVDGVTLMKDVPASYLLFLEKQLTDLHTLVSKMPLLDNAEEWEFDKNAEVWKAAPTTTVRTKKIQKPLVLYPATDKHPAQTQLITEDETVGHWDMVKFSGAMSLPEGRAMVLRIERLKQAVKFAREQANEAPVQEVNTQALFDWLMKG